MSSSALVRTANDLLEVPLVEVPAFVAAASMRIASVCASDFLVRLVDCFNLRTAPSDWVTSKQAVQKGEFGRLMRVATGEVPGMSQDG